MSNAENVVSRLKEIVGEANVIDDPEQLKAFTVDGLTPKAIVSPGTIEETAKVVSLANGEGWGLIPRGNGTKMALGGIPQKADVVLSTRRMNRFNDYDIANLTISVEGGLTLAEVQEKLAGEGKGYFVALDPPYTREATVGGIVATNDSGPKRFLYGAARDIILGIKAVSPTGEIVSWGGKAVKNVAGYDMTKLMIGSMGSLGIICEITFRVTPMYDADATLLVPFADLKEAAGYLHKLLHSKFYPATLELMNAKTAAALPGASGLKGAYVAAVAVEGIEEAVARLIEELTAMGRQEGGSDVVVLKDQPHRDFWIAYRDLVGTLAKDAKPLVVLKSNFTLSKVSEMMTAFETALKEAGKEGFLTCRAGNGLLYAAIDPGNDPAGLAPLVTRLTDAAERQGGNLVVTMAPRVLKEKVGVWGKSRSDAVLVRRLKEKLDPSGILNPGRFVAGV